MNQADRDKLLQETHDTVQTIKTVVLGANGDGGLVEEVKEVAKSHYNLKRIVWLLIGMLVGSGVLVGGWQLLLQIT